MEPKISIILTVYNTIEEILCETIESIINQSFGDFELIIVDDGSTNGCGSVCDEYQLQDQRINVIHKTNGGICEARNSGLSVAKGEYITFCDHDDIYEADKLNVSYTLAKKYNADIVIVGKEIVSKFGGKVVGLDLCAKNIDEVQQSLGDILEQRLLENVWNILYRNDLINGMLFDTRFKHGQEDYNFNLNVLKRVNKLVSTSKSQYRHIVRDELSTSSKIYKDLAYDMAITNNGLYDLINYYGINHIDNKDKVIRAEASQLRMCTAYAVKSGFNYDKFKRYIYNLKFHRCNITYSGPLIDVIVYFAISHKLHWLLFFMLKSKYCWRNR